ncbi:uncharacterized protein LOC134283484 [Saccostrea cucullata]|uniref:uncharacterized protein LOC134283484 n=1 Tax=Saccostrea cuccullata TaxID=36930 RepID=UPI002ED244DF
MDKNIAGTLKIRLTYIFSQRHDKAEDCINVCKIPKLDVYNPGIRYKIGEIELKCKNKASFTFENGHRLEINWTAVRLSNVSSTFSSCTYQPIIRPVSVPNHNFFQYGPESAQFYLSVNISDEFIRVKCFDKTNTVIYTNFHQFVFQKPDVERRCNKAFKEHSGNPAIKEKLNVILLGTDSISRLQSVRSLKRTRAYLHEVLEAFELTMYNKIGDNTFPNIAALTLGKFVEEIPYNESYRHVPFDKHNFIWKQFSAKGYRSLYIEDRSGTFDYMMAGFHSYPSDYYNRHFFMAMKEEKSVWNTDDLCMMDRLETGMVLDYAAKFVRLQQNSPYFAFSFATTLTHDEFYHAQYADLPLLNFIRELHEDQLLNNTLLIVFSDHGIRIGNYRNTYEGMMEERLPMMHLVFPKWFKEKYPLYSKNLKLNTKRLTTPFDIYETLRDVLNFDDKIFQRKGYKNRGISLFREIPKERTCKDAGIAPHWCTCVEHTVVNTSDNTIIFLSDFLVRSLNRKLSNVQDKCEVLALEEIRHASKVQISESVLETRKRKVKPQAHYQIKIKTKPGGALFEATIFYDERFHFRRLDGDISRINKYGNQASCISENHELEKYCLCRK